MNRDAQVRDLLRRGFISTVFQPIVDLESGAFAGYEALMRGPKGTVLESPLNVFGPHSPLSADTLLELDRACIAAALRTGQLLAGKAALFINVEMETLLQGRSALAGYERLLESSAVPPSRIVLELSERATPREPHAVAAALRFLRKRFGFRIALDDLGSAYAGLQHFLWFEPDLIKLDRDLVDGVANSYRKRTVLSHLASMARALGCAVVAEGVDSQEDLLVLMDAGVLLGQGYHFGHPEEALYWHDEAAHPDGFRAWFQVDPSEGLPA